MNFMSLFSGIEAASVAWKPLGWKAVSFSEIEKFPSAVLAHHYPDVPNLGDITKHKDWPVYEPDVIVGGSPCQAFSVAGLRKGLDDPRGNLTLTYLAVVEQYRPRWMVWENVPGVLSIDGGGVFGAFLGALGELGYGVAYRILDAQYFGVPQRRRRVFVVGYLGDWRRAAAVLFERHSLSGNPAPSRKAGACVAGSLNASFGSRGASGEVDGASAGYIVPTLDASFGRLQGCSGQDANHGHGHLIPEIVGQAMSAKWAKGTAGPAGDEHHNLIPVPLAVQASQSGVRINETVGTLDANYGSRRHNGVMVPIPFDTTQITSAGNYSNPQSCDPCHPLSACSHAPAIAFDCKASGQNGFGVGDIASTMRSMGHAGSHQNGGGHLAVAVPINIYGGGSREDRPNGGFYVNINEDTSKTLDSSSGLNPVCSQGGTGVITDFKVRRLTATECERLQGFPDGHTMIPWRGKPASMCPDGPRYKALGNSMAVPVMAWIGRRIQMVEDLNGTL